jgi:hypothetical protein
MFLINRLKQSIKQVREKRKQIHTKIKTNKKLRQ